MAHCRGLHGGLHPAGRCGLRYVAGETQGLSAAAKQQIIEAYQLDKPIIVQYMTYLKNFFSGQLGTSTARKGVPITMIIAKMSGEMNLETYMK